MDHSPSVGPPTDCDRRRFLQAMAGAAAVAAAPLRRPPPAARVQPLSAMTRRAVLDDPRLDFMNVEHIQRLVRWLGNNGFRRLDAERLAGWMRQQMDGRDAYGSVVVLPLDVCPSDLLAGPSQAPLWLRYLHAGGRLVWLGEAPFEYVESPTVQPPPFNLDYSRRGLGLIGCAMPGWSSPYWGNGSLPVAPNPAAKGWGFETVGSAVVGYPAKDVTLPFDLYTAANGKKGTADWFKNVRPDLPWSGFVIRQQFDGNNDACLRDAWRAANYVGQPLLIPPMPPPARSAAPSAIWITRTGGGMTGRHEYVRGEKLEVTVVAKAAAGATSMRLELKQKNATLWHEEKTCTPDGDADHGAVFSLDTSPYAYGVYEVQATAMREGKALCTISQPLGIRHIPPKDFNWDMWWGVGNNPVRSDLECRNISQTGMELYLVGDSPRQMLAGVDAATRYGLGFSLRAMPDLAYGRSLTFENNPQYYRIGTDGKPASNAYSGGRPSLGISNPAIYATAFEPFVATIKQLAGHPGLRPYVLTDDDYSVYYGFDYAPHVLADFKAKTGLTAPRKKELPKTYGAVPEDNPWLQWCIYTLKDICAAFNKAQTDAALRVRPDLRVGPIPGGMQIPLVSMWDAGQYPTYDFGKNGFNLVSSYYYNTYWQPPATTTFWMEVGHMDNRELPEWNLADCFMTAGYTRNNFFHYLAGGVKGLAYFTYDQRNSSTWPEMRRLGEVVRRIGPIQTRLVAAKRDIGLLDSFTTDCFHPANTLVRVYGYLNLLQGHFDVEMVSENEILQGRSKAYRAVLLYNVQYLSRKVYDALAAHVVKGGLVLLDRSIPFDIPGAKRLKADIGMGTGHTLGAPPNDAARSTPGPLDYGIAARVEVIKTALSDYVQPHFESDDIRLVATRFAAGGVPYIWFVNALDGQEYALCHECMGAGVPGANTPAKKQKLLDWETAQMASGPYVSSIVLDTFPGVPYDLVGGRKIPMSKTPDGRYTLTLAMERFGGMLVAFLPEEITGVTPEAPARPKRGQPCEARATVRGTSRPIPGVISVAFTLKDPRGSVSPASGVRATQDGSAHWQWTPAVNDPAGRWTLEAMELASGHTARVTLALN